MAYSKQNFQDGQILNAANLEAMENGIIAGQGARNLLDNSDFTNPVNQRGIANSATIERYTYFLDRWSTGSTAGTITLDSNGLTFNVLISQKIDPAILRTGTTVTAAAKFSDGTLVIVSGVVNLSTSWHWLPSPVVNGCQIGLADGTSDGIPYVRIGNEYGKTLVWAALYEGAYTADTLPPYIPKGKHVEMLNCGVPLAPHNLLDNSDFRNPVNQRGRTEASGNGYFIDRWGNYNGTSKVVSSGIQVNANKDSAAFLYQYIKALRDGTYTFAAKVNGNIVLRVIQISGATVTSINGDKAAYTGGYLVVIYANDDKFEFDFRVESGATITVEWAALYEGSYDASTLPAYQPKGYAAELAECMRYFERLGVVNSDILGTVAFAKSGAKSVIISMQYQPKRINKPTLVFGDVSKYRLLLMDTVNASVFSASAISSFDEINVQSPFASVRVTMPNPLDRDCWVVLQREDGSDGAYIDVNADI